ncbi:hypothetical protein MN608_06971 [Microdochium nivale]|nr:hypothetical protein MN608_06971 [Microdochium nivale]
MFSLADFRRRSTLAFTNSKPSDTQHHPVHTTVKQAEHVRGRSEAVVWFSAPDLKWPKSAGLVECSRSRDPSRALPELYFEDFSLDPGSQPRSALKITDRLPRSNSSTDVSTNRPALTSRPPTHIADLLDVSRLVNTEQRGPLNRPPPPKTLVPLNTNSERSFPTLTKKDEASPVSTASTSLEQLVENTEHAFDAVTSTLACMKTASQSYGSIPSIPPTPPPKDPARLLRADMNCCNATKPPPSRRKSAKGVSRPKSQKTQRPRKSYQLSNAGRRVTATPQAPTKKHSTRWGLTGNVSDLFSMSRFQKIEADEVVTPRQIEAFKIRKNMMAQVEREEQDREREQAKSRSSLDSMFLDELVGHCDTPDPEMLPQLIGGTSSTTSSIYSSDEQTCLEDNNAATELTRKDNCTVNVADDEHSFTFLEDKTPSARSSPVPFLPKDLPALPASPSPPARSPRRPLIVKSPAPLLPALTEDCEVFALSPSPMSAISSYSTEFVFLRSTPCTLTAPSIRHGPIRFSRCVVPQEDDGLDWTSFQVAIQGGAGDWFSESEETIRRREADEAKDIAAWWSSWNFDSAGDLFSKKHEDPEPCLPAISSTRSSLDCGENADSAASLSDGSDEHDDDDEEDDELSESIAGYSLSPSNPYSAYHKWNRLSQQASVRSTPRSDADASKQAITQDAKTGESRFDSGLQVMHNVSSDAVDYMPMGCNLTSDLGDFLRWEAEHAYASMY